MKVAHLSTSESLGGAAQATYKLHRELIKQGIESRLYVRYPSGVKPNEVYSLTKKSGIWEEKVKPRIRKYKLAQLKEQYKPASYIPFSYNTLLPHYPLKETFIQEADVIGLYWIGEFLNPENLALIQKPIVWRLSDIWPFSGGCHYPGNCTGYTTGCGQCPKLNSKDPDDFSKKLVNRKKEAYKDLSITVAAPTRWIAKLASESLLFRDRPIEVIPTGVDETHFKPLLQSEIRRAFSIPEDKILILFGADSATDPRKGIQYLTEALKILKNKLGSELCLGIFGGYYDPALDKLGLEVRYFGYITELYLPVLYNCADVFVAPSLEENLPNTALEAMACGIPVVGFHTGGMPELISSGHNGFLAELNNAESLAWGIEETLRNHELMSKAARQTILKSFTQQQQTASYIKLYQNLKVTDH